MKDIGLILGIRPDVIRASKVIKLLHENNDIDFDFIWSGNGSNPLVFFKSQKSDENRVRSCKSRLYKGKISALIIFKIHC